MTAFNEKRLGRVLLSEAFVTADRSADLFRNFKILLAQPRYNEPGMIAYYGAHPDFDIHEGEAKDSPYYDAYWADERVTAANPSGFYFKMHQDGVRRNPARLGLTAFLNEVDQLMLKEFGTTHRDIEDYNWEDEYDSEVPADEAFEEWKIHTEGGTRSPGNF